MKQAVTALALALSFSWLPSSAWAELSAANQREAEAAFRAVTALAQQTRAQGGPPRWSEADQAKALTRMWNVPATLGAPPYKSADVPALLAIGDRANGLFKAYVFFAPYPGVVPDTAANTLKYQDEIVRALAYVLRVHAAGLEAVTDFLRTLPASQMNEARRSGLKMVQLGGNELVTGATTMLRSPGLRPENRAILLDGLAASVENVAAAAPLADRKALIAQLEASLPALSEAEREKALALKAAFERKDCEGLCALGGS